METRRVVTALFFDTVGSTALGEVMDPEDLQLVVGHGVDRMAAVAEEFGGSVRTPSGDGAMVLFGSPYAHEDDPERALRAGLKILVEMERYADQVRADWRVGGFGVRIGIETGTVALSGVGGAGGLGAMGDALNTAARLEAAAHAGTVLVGERTHRAVEHLFVWEGPMLLDLKGKQQPVAAWRALQPRSGAPRRRGTATPLTGRRTELTALLNVVDGVLEGQGGVVSLRGVAGIGKTRLLGGARSRFTAGGGLWLEGRCVSYGDSLALHPFSELLEPLGAARLLEAPPSLPPPLASEHVFAAIADRLAEAAGSGPVAMVVEDIHWSDATSLALLTRLLELTEQVPLLLVLTARPDPDHASQELLLAARTRDNTVSVELTGIDPDSERRLLEHLLGRELPAHFAERVLDRSEGNPLYLEELARAVSQSDQMEIPETIEKIVLSRYDRLDSRAQDLAAAASVLGRRFTLEDLPPTVSRDPIDTLVRAEIVGQDDENAYAFRHAVIQEAIYGGLLRRRREELHAAVASGLEARGAGPALLAHHFSASGQHAKALSQYLVAAQELDERGFGEAGVQALGALSAAERLGLSDTDPQVIDALRHLGVARFSASDLAGSQAAIERALRASRAAGDTRREIACLQLLANAVRTRDWGTSISSLREADRLAEGLRDDDVRAASLARLAIGHVSQLDLTAADEAASQAVAAAERAGTRASAAAGLDARKTVAWQLGAVDELERASQALLALVNPDRQEEAYDLWDVLRYAFALLERTWVPLAHGDFAQARERAELALVENRRTAMRVFEALALDTFTWIERAAHAGEAAVSAARRASFLAAETGSREWRAWTAASLGAALLEVNEADEAIRVLQDGLEHARASAAKLQHLRCAALLAHGYQRLTGDPGPVLAEALEQAAAVRTPPGSALLFAADALLALAAVLDDRGETQAAVAIRQPIAQARRRQGWRIEWRIERPLYAA